MSTSKSTRQDIFDPVNSHGDVAGGQSGNFSDGRGVQFFEIANDDLAVERFELLNERRQAFQIDLPVGG
jgi:hypothetical protein